MTAGPGRTPRRIGPFDVPAIGLGCMNLSHAYGVPPTPEAAARLLRTALDQGVTLFDTAALYGFGGNEQLLGRVLAGDRDRIVLASKCGMTGVDGRRVIDGRPETIRHTADRALARLRTDTIDLYYLHRIDRQVPVEESVGAMAELVAAGKVRALGLSEASAATLRRAHAVHPIAALQNEYSLWSRNPEQGTLAAAHELGVALVAFSPLARGFLTSAPPDPAGLPAADIRRGMPRFDDRHYPANLALRHELARIAEDAGLTLAQLALAWVTSRGPHVVAIPGTRSTAHLRENLSVLDAEVPEEALHAAGLVLNSSTVHGPRYHEATLTEIDTERCGRAG
ncbi:aldo/keto reductase [Kitasatospora cheerisanensis]|uniref:Aldo/keto reductase n=1 Tax=Kitasatospora cheerisanensis KCTC 2395 TaxID=1348663 RepID=A0A066Z2T8_9ACTN|nr:aldo/keto reductase [Kitasatospora cheerisanensis]KDN87802.1 aldo/keto reductase [Kitasatospora cheerisanensis KCTC 2395]